MNHHHLKELRETTYVCILGTTIHLLLINRDRGKQLLDARDMKVLEAAARNSIVTKLAEHAFFIGLTLRLFLAWFLPWLLDDGRFIPGVAYTDIDYLVFTDAANYVKQGKSPYLRHTYRYSPFLAEILACMPKPAGRYLFCLADAICGWIIVRFRRSKRMELRKHDNLNHNEATKEEDTTACEGDPENSLIDALCWLFNPLAINICTRGSSESLMVLLPVLLTIGVVTSTPKQQLKWSHALLAGMFHGLAVHSKLYPIIYTLSYMSYFATTNLDDRSNTEGKNPSQMGLYHPSPRLLFHFILRWARRLLKPLPLLFFTAFAVTFGGSTYVAVDWYEEALEEAFLYHFSRVDHRHNYSIFWYWIYLARSIPRGDMVLVGRLLLVPQAFLLLYSSLGVAPYKLGLALFLQTYIFVTFNKVITAQYFSWYLCLLPLCTDELGLTSRVQHALLGLGFSVATWLGCAFCLEMQGMNVHGIVWLASLFHFGANVNLMGALLYSCTNNTNTAESSGATTFTSIEQNTTSSTGPKVKQI